MNVGHIEYKTVLFIKGVLETQLDKSRQRLTKCQRDVHCSRETYENQLDFCEKLEYAIREMEKQI